MNKALLFAVPGVALGLLFGFLYNIPVAAMIYDYTELEPEYSIAPEAIVASAVLGLVMPVVANIAPISRALSHTLRDSLDVYHAVSSLSGLCMRRFDSHLIVRVIVLRQVVSDVTVRVVRLAELGLDLWQTALAVSGVLLPSLLTANNPHLTLLPFACPCKIMLIVVGFLTFYVIPYAFIFRLLPLALGILNAILLGMLLGLCIISQVLQPYVQRIILWVLTRWTHPQLFTLVRLPRSP